MAKQRNAVRVGIFVLFCIAAVIAIAVAIVGGAQFFQRTQMRSVTFTLADNVGGLNVGDDVRIGGFKVGDIKTIDVDQPSAAGAPPRIVVSFDIPEKYTLRTGANIEVEGTLTGQSWLNIVAMGTGDVLDPSAPLAGNPSALTQLTAALGGIAPDLRQIVSNVKTVTLPHADAALSNANGLISDGRVKIQMLYPHLLATLDRAGEALRTIRDLLGPSTTDFHGTMSNLNQVTADLRTRTPALLDSAGTLLHRVNDITAKLSDTLVDLRSTIVNLKDSTGVLRSVVIGNRGKLESLIANLKSTGENLNAASQEIRRSPWRLLYKPSANEVANLNLYDSTRAFSEGAANLNDASQALRDALADPNADPAMIKKLDVQLEQSFAHFKDVEAKLWTTVQQ